MGVHIVPLLRMLMGVLSYIHLIQYCLVKLYQIFSNILYPLQVSLIQGSPLP